VKGTPSRYVFMVSFFTICLFITGCRARFSSLSPSDPSQAEPPFIQFVEKSFGTDWYGIYIQKRKVGYLKSTSGREKDTEGTIYNIQLSGLIHIPSKEETSEMKIHMDASFNTQPPYSLIRYSERMMYKDDISKTHIIRTSKGYEARITQGGETRARMIGSLEYTLKDHTAVQRWITRNPKEGDQIKYPYLNSETLTLEEKTSRIQGIHKTIISGVKTSYYNVITSGFDGFEVHEEFGADGRPYRIVLGGVFECRLEPKSLATHVDVPVGLFIKNTVPSNRPLGDPGTVTLLKFKIDKASGGLLKNASGQTVSDSQPDDSVIVTLNYKGDYQTKATHEEIEKNLADSIHVPISHPKIIRMARNAVANTETPAEKVKNLVHFVYQYIEDDYTANPLTVMDIIEKKRGDCSEHARLFTAMARALGIPCRIVGGLVYLGDELQEFGLHAWNEVVIDGNWVPVDPTWGQTRVDATHIRFSTELSEEWQIMAAIPNMKIEVLHVEYKK